MRHKTFAELHQKILEAEKIIPVGSQWIHYKDEKGVHPYVVLKLALEEATEEVVVVYRREDMPDSFIWTRPVNGESEWLSSVNREGKEVPRFNIQKRQSRERFTI